MTTEDRRRWCLVVVEVEVWEVEGGAIRVEGGRRGRGWVWGEYIFQESWAGWMDGLVGGAEFVDYMRGGGRVKWMLF